MHHFAGKVPHTNNDDIVEQLLTSLESEKSSFLVQYLCTQDVITEKVQHIVLENQQSIRPTQFFFEILKHFPYI